MTSYTVDDLPGKERGIRVECDEHGDWEEFQPGYRTVSFYCEGCARELEVTLHRENWRDLGEMC